MIVFRHICFYCWIHCCDKRSLGVLIETLLRVHAIFRFNISIIQNSMIRIDAKNSRAIVASDKSPNTHRPCVHVTTIVPVPVMEIEFHNMFICTNDNNEKRNTNSEKKS